MTSPYKNIALAVSFSPTSKKMLVEAKRLKELFSAKLSVMHIGEKNPENQELLAELLKSSGIKIDDVVVIYEPGNPVNAIIKVCHERKIDLLIAGALQKEKFFNYYMGSIARTLMRDVPCSVLFLNASQEIPKSFTKICVATDFSSRSEYTLKKAHEWAIAEKLKEITLIREFQVPGLAMTVNDSGSLDETADLRKKWEKDEIEKLNLFIRELNLTEIDYNFVCLYGKQGWESKNYVNQNDADLFIVSAPKRKLGLFDRIFPSGLEFLAKQLPCSLLLVKSVETK